MNANNLKNVEILDYSHLSRITGGDGGLSAAILVGYGILIGYTNEKCRIDKGKHWYCIKVN